MSLCHFFLFFFKQTFGFQKVFSLFRHPTFCLLVPLHCNTAWYENSTESESIQVSRFGLGPYWVGSESSWIWLYTQPAAFLDLREPDTCNFLPVFSLSSDFTSSATFPRISSNFPHTFPSFSLVFPVAFPTDLPLSFLLQVINFLLLQVSLYFLQFLSISSFWHLISSQSPSFLLNVHAFLHRSKYFIAITLYFGSSGGCILKRNACEIVLLPVSPRLLCPLPLQNPKNSNTKPQLLLALYGTISLHTATALLWTFFLRSREKEIERKERL